MDSCGAVAAAVHVAHSVAPAAWCFRQDGLTSSATRRTTTSRTTRSRPLRACAAATAPCARARARPRAYDLRSSACTSCSRLSMIGLSWSTSNTNAPTPLARRRSALSVDASCGSGRGFLGGITTTTSACSSSRVIERPSDSKRNAQARRGEEVTHPR